MYFCSLFYHQLAHGIREFSDQNMLVSLSTKWGEYISPNSFSERLQSSWGGKNCWGLKNVTLFVAITHYYVFNQSLSDFAQVGVADHLNSRNDAPCRMMECLKIGLNPGTLGGTVYRCAFCAVFSGALGPPPRARNSDKWRRMWGSKPRGLSLCPKGGLRLVKC